MLKFDIFEHANVIKTNNTQGIKFTSDVGRDVSFNKLYLTSSDEHVGNVYEKMVEHIKLDINHRQHKHFFNSILSKSYNNDGFGIIQQEQDLQTSLVKLYRLLISEYFTHSYDNLIWVFPKNFYHQLYQLPTHIISHYNLYDDSIMGKSVYATDIEMGHIFFGDFRTGYGISENGDELRTHYTSEIIMNKKSVKIMKISKELNYE